MPHPEGYRKALRLMRYAAKFGMPIVTLVDTPGAYPGLGAEERGQSIAIAQSILEMSRLPRPDRRRRHRRGRQRRRARAGVGDRVLMLENAYYSVISPEGCSTILFKDAAAGAARRRRAAAHRAATCCGSGHGRDRPRAGGRRAHRPRAAAANLKTAIVEHACASCSALEPEELLERRYDRFRPFGDPGRPARPARRLERAE